MLCSCCSTVRRSSSREATLQNELLLAMAALWGFSFLAALLEPSGKLARAGIVLGCGCGVAACLMGLPGAAPTIFAEFSVSDTPVKFHLDAGGCWLLLFGLLTALFAAALNTTASSQSDKRYWLAGLSLTLLGALEFSVCRMPCPS